MRYILGRLIILDNALIMASFNVIKSATFKIGLINLNHSKQSNLLVANDCGHLSLELLALNEPYYYNEVITGFANITLIYEDNCPRSAIAVIGKDLKVNKIFVNRDIVIISVYKNMESFLFASVYSPPSSELEGYVNILDEILNKYSTKKVIIAGDFNAKSELWGPQLKRQ